MSYEVVYTMSRPATPAEWEASSTLIAAWLEASAATCPALFAPATIVLGDESLTVELTGAEDLIVERLADTPIWSVRTSSTDAARVLAGVLLSLQFACTAEAFQLSGSKKNQWQQAASALTPYWGGEFQARLMAPRKHRADSLVYVDHARNAQHLRAYFRTQLELDDMLLPDRDFRDVLVDS
jgi:hypothetical protein